MQKQPQQSELKLVAYMWSKKGYGRRYFDHQYQAEDVIRDFGGWYIPLYAREPIPNVEDDMATEAGVEAA